MYVGHGGQYKYGMALTVRVPCRSFLRARDGAYLYVCMSTETGAAGPARDGPVRWYLMCPVDYGLSPMICTRRGSEGRLLGTKKEGTLRYGVCMLIGLVGRVLQTIRTSNTYITRYE